MHKIRYKESYLHTKLMRQHRRDVLSKKKTINIYPQIIAHVSKVSLNRIQLDSLSRNYKSGIFHIGHVRDYEQKAEAYQQKIGTYTELTSDPLWTVFDNDKLLRPLFDKHVRSTTIIDGVDLIRRLEIYVANNYIKPKLLSKRKGRAGCRFSNNFLTKGLSGLRFSPSYRGHLKPY
ncbi:unnamed protein product, partial [Didymodactylos carnosus]